MALFAEMGTGKTGATINILRHKYYEHGRQLKTLIFSPLVTLFNWQDEILKHSYVKQRDTIVLHKGGSAGKLKTFQKEVGTFPNKIVIINYEAMLSDKLFEALKAWGPEVVVCDEAHYCKNHKAKRSKKVALLADQALHRYILTGTPILNNIADLFMQYRILDGGETFGKSFTVFQRKYMEDENAVWKARAQGNYFPKWVARPEKYPELQDKIYSKAIRVLKKDCLDLPPMIKKVLKVELSKAQQKYYDEMMRDFVTFVKEQEKSGVVVAQLAITKALRLQQIVTGFVQTDEGDVIEIKENPRLNATKELLTGLHENHKVIIWCSFRHNYKQLAKLCDDLKIEYVSLTGEQNLEQKRDAMERFETDEQVRVVIANRRAGGIGVNLVAADYSIVYSRNFSLEEELQSEARNYRGGSQQHERIVKIDLCAMGTIDERVVEALHNKQNVSERVIDLAKENL
jgi:SNF2 family DNA or RNA helicase